MDASSVVLSCPEEDGGTHVDGGKASAAAVEGLVVEVHKLLANLLVRHGVGIDYGVEMELDAKR